MPMARTEATNHLYEQLAAFARRARSLSAAIHPELSLVAFTLLAHVAREADVRAADLAEHYALDRSTVSRHLDVLEARGLLRRGAERPGRRGHVLELTPRGTQVLAAADKSLQNRLAERLAPWSDADVASLADLLTRFNSTFD